MIALGIETATAVCSVGLADDTGILTENHVVETHIHSEKILTLVAEVVRGRGTRLDDVDVVAISNGPGSFTGLRIGLSTAKGLCFALEKPLVAVSTFESIAYAAIKEGSDEKNILVALDAKKGDFYVATFGKDNKFPAQSGETSVSRIDVLKDLISSDGQILVISDAIEKVKPALGNDHHYRHVHDFCRGDIVASLGLRKARAGTFSDVASVEPAYLKNFVAHGRNPI